MDILVDSSHHERALNSSKILDSSTKILNCVLGKRSPFSIPNSPALEGAREEHHYILNTQHQSLLLGIANEATTEVVVRCLSKNVV